MSLALLISAALACPASAQSAPIKRDTLGTPFTFPAFVDGILANHPVATQARLVADQARSDLRTAWGAFDPTVTASWDQKTFGGTQYYNYFDAELKIPLPIGADVTLDELALELKALSGKMEHAMDVSTNESADCTAPTSATTFKSIFLGNSTASTRLRIGFGLLGKTMGKSFSI
jgi:hypothetical protein